jgi:hypothetical protein
MIAKMAEYKRANKLKPNRKNNDKAAKAIVGMSIDGIESHK